MSRIAVTIENRNNLDALRFLFATTVVFFHLAGLGRAVVPEAFRWLLNGEIAVNGFFVISGFLISASWNRSRSARNYIDKRVRRLVPAYVAVVLVCAFFLVTIATVSPLQYFTSSEFIRYIVCNLLFLNFLAPSLPGVFDSNVLNAVNGALWTIKIEVMFYCVVPALWALLTRLGRLWLQNACLAAIYFGAVLFRAICHYLEIKFSFPGVDQLVHQLPGYMDFFAVGMALYLNFQFLRANLPAVASVALGILLLGWVLPTNPLFPLALGGVILVLGFGLKGLNSFGKYGDFSYGTYVWHFPLIQFMVAVGFLRPELPLSYFATFAIVLLFAFLSWNLVEKRFLGLRVAKASLPIQSEKGDPSP